ncbi:alpha/beta-hydrolase, partial [Setomelanomma holmii]
QSLTLPSTRTLGYAIYGSSAPTSPVIFLFHGMPGSRLVGRSFSTAAHTVGARLITIDRPGCGLSTFAERKLVEWPDDVLALADHMGIEKFSILGASAGGPFALACAWYIPATRLQETTVVCGIGPLDALYDTVPMLGWRLGGMRDWIVRMVARWIVLPGLIRPYLRNDTPSGMKDLLISQCSTPEEKDMALKTPPDDDGHIDNAVAQMREAFKQGNSGAYLDGKILTSDWGFKLENVDASRVRLVHGSEDKIAPVEVAKWIDAKLGGGRLEVVERGTHFTIWKDEMEGIL